jgi:hypothetical protein
MNYPIYSGDNIEIARLDYPAVYIFLDLIDDAMTVHGEDLVQLFVSRGWSDPLGQAAKCLDTLEILEIIKKASEHSSPSASQKFFGVGGGFKVAGKNAPLICYNWVRGNKGLCRPALDKILEERC